MKEGVQVLRAADAAARWHVHQRRKGAAEEPYIKASQRAKVLKLAGKTSNLHSLAACAPKHWSVKRRVAFGSRARGVSGTVGVRAYSSSTSSQPSSAT